MAASHVTATMTVNEVMSKWPATIAVFRRRQMACVGCSVASFTTVGEAARIYGLSLDSLLSELAEQVMASDTGADHDS